MRYSKKYVIKGKYDSDKPRVVRLSPAKAVKAICLDCMEYRSRMVRECGHLECSLRPYREGKHNLPEINDQVKDAIASYCLGCSEGQVIEQCNLCLLRPWKAFEVQRKAG